METVRKGYSLDVTSFALTSIKLRCRSQMFRGAWRAEAERQARFVRKRHAGT